ncbi:hypothetical protein ABHV46_08955 [Asaia sp. BMEF1]|uniref:hypothetical protein n=1 Tax=Asaia sp. BMEF1 TaxID=3155932 RepID=UPI003F676B60
MARQLEKTISFWKAGHFFRKSTDWRFLYRSDASLPMVGMVALGCLINLITHILQASVAKPGGQSQDPWEHHTFFEIVALWFLSLVVTRCALTTWSGPDLWRMDWGALKSVCTEAVCEIILGGALVLIVKMPALLPADASAGMELLLLLVLTIAGITCLWIFARCFAMSSVAWKSARPQFRIRQSFEAMSGHVWSYIFWSSVIVFLPIVLMTLLQKAMNALWTGNATLLAGVVCVTLTSAATRILSQNFDLQFFRALGLDTPVPAEAGPLSCAHEI